MKSEISAAVDFISQLVRHSPHLSKQQVDSFSEQLKNVLASRFKDHWHEDKPVRGQAYRCMRVCDREPHDSVIQHAAGMSGIRYCDLCLPSDITVWVDPQSVTCRFGEHYNAVQTLALFTPGCSENTAGTVNVDRLLDKFHETKERERKRFLEMTAERHSPSPTTPAYNGGHYRQTQSHQNYTLTTRQNYNPAYSGSAASPELGSSPGHKGSPVPRSSPGPKGSPGPRHNNKWSTISGSSVNAKPFFPSNGNRGKGKGRSNTASPANHGPGDKYHWVRPEGAVNA